MKLIALVGLATIEKIDLAVELTRYYSTARILSERISSDGQSVTLINNVSADFIRHVPVDSERLGGATLVNVSGEIIGQLESLLTTIDTDMVVLVVSDDAHPDAFFMELEGVCDAIPDLDVRTAALIDARTRH